MTLREASSRRAVDFAPQHRGESVVLHGRVNSRAVPFLRYSHLGIQDETGGFVLESPGAELGALVPGDEIEAEGSIGARGGLPILEVSSVRVTGHASAPQPVPVKVGDIRSTEFLGQLVKVTAKVAATSENSGGAYLLIDGGQQPYKIFLPFSPTNAAVSFGAFREGDTVSATGIASQYCPSAPFNRNFQLLVRRTADVQRLSSAWTPPPSVIAALACVMLLFVTAWYIRERRAEAEREMLTRTFQLGEAMLTADSVAAILRKLETGLPPIFGGCSVQLFLFNRSSRTLNPTPEGDPISLDAPAAGLPTATAACFANRTLLAIPDSHRGPFASMQDRKSLLLAPMFSHGDPVGVLQIATAAGRDFHSDQQTIAQHLANEAGMAIRLLEQVSIREQLHRTEKLAAVGRLISGVVNDLQEPLAAIRRSAEAVLTNGNEMVRERELRAMSGEAHRAGNIVSRLVAFAGTGSPDARPVDVERLVRRLLEFREREWKARGIRLAAHLSEQRLTILGSEGQIEQVLLELLVNAEQAAAESEDMTIGLRTGLLANRVLVEITFQAERLPAGLDVCRSIIAGHGGDLRVATPRTGECRIEVDLPYARSQTAAPRRRTAPLDAAQAATVLVMEPDTTAQQRIVAMLSSRGFRAVPATSSEIALDLAQRMRFDVAFCSVHLPGLNWVELSKEMLHHVPVFALLSDGFDAELAATFEGGGRFVLPKPVHDEALDRVLEAARPLARTANGAAVTGS